MHITSAMMVNPLNVKHLQKISQATCGIITLNLEDGISIEQKPQALKNIKAFFTQTHQTISKVVVRVNELENGGLEEIQELKDFAFDALRIPKIKDAHEVQKVLDMTPFTKQIHLSCETKEAFSNIATLKCDSRVTTLYLGLLDLLNSLQIPQSNFVLKNPLVDYILSKFLIDAKSVGFFPVGFTFQDYNDTETFASWCRYLKSFGYAAIGSIGPKQSQIAQEIFGINTQELQKARQIVTIFEQKAKEGISGFLDPSFGFIDEPIYKNAKMIIEQSDGF